MEKSKISATVLEVLYSEGVDCESLTVRVRDLETGITYFTDGVRRRGYNYLIITLDGEAWGWLSVGMAMEVAE